MLPHKWGEKVYKIVITEACFLVIAMCLFKAKNYLKRQKNNNVRKL